MHLEVPIIETQRLTLRPFREEDVDPLFELSQNPATRLGESLRGDIDLLGHRVLVYGISRSEWEARAQA
jgi:hypothetical protein